MYYIYPHLSIFFRGIEEKKWKQVTIGVPGCIHRSGAKDTSSANILLILFDIYAEKKQMKSKKKK